MFKAILKGNNLLSVKFHELRETYSTLLLKNNFNSKSVSKLMEHTADIIVIDAYEDNDERIANCVDKLNSYIEIVC